MTGPPTGNRLPRAPPAVRGAAEGTTALDGELHDLANSLASARTYAEVARRRASGGDPTVLDALVGDLERAAELLRRVRRRVFRSGDTLECRGCGSVFVYRGATGAAATCRRCRSNDVERWVPK